MSDQEREYHNRQLDAQFQEVCLRILDNARSELYLSMRYMDLALYALEPEITTQYPGFGTDGRIFYVHPHMLMDLFEANRLRVNRVFLHTVFHCILRHLFKRKPEDVQLWDIACDMAVEYVIDGMRVRSVRMGVSGLRRNWYDLLGGQLKVPTAEGIYHVLLHRGISDFERRSLLAEFHIDDHALWQRSDPQERPDPSLQMLRDRWQDISEKTKTQMEAFASDASDGESGLREQMKAELVRRYDYRSFLRKFAVWREEMHTDPDNFDYVFYTYGLQLYKNMPLVEPLESREVKRVRDFVIVVDVSMSTQGELVKNFLNQTYEVLTEQESFTGRVHIRILQCDDQVREDIQITDREELDACMKSFTLKGGGGTDFRPAFAHVRSLLEKKAFHDLKGMIYFTDGKGIYPGQKPPWETAFVFLAEDYRDVNVPAWAIKLILPARELEEKKDTDIRTDYMFV